MILRTKRTACLAGLLIVAAGCRVEPPARSEADARAAETGLRGIVQPAPGPRPDFVLTDTRGRPYDFRARTRGRLALLFFGYTHCPDICPVHMAGIAAVKRDLPPEAQRALEVVFVTADPERDTPEVIRQWLDHFDHDFTGLRGPKPKIDSIQLSLGLPPSVLQGEGDEYLVGHASQVLAFPPGDSIRVVYPFGTRQADWAHDLPRLLGMEGADLDRLRERRTAPGTWASGALLVTGLAAAEPARPDRTAAWLQVRNRGARPDRLVGASSPAAGRIELHRQAGTGGRARMEPVEGFPVPAGGVLRLEPGGAHLMLLDLRRGLAAGDTIDAELRFEATGSLKVRIPVVPYAEMSAGADGGS